MAAKKKNAPKPPDEADMMEVFEETRESDVNDAKMSQSGKRVKACHHLVQEAHALLVAARRETATNAIVHAELERVMELTREIYEEAEAAQKALDR